MLRLIILLMIFTMPATAQDAVRINPRLPLTTTAKPPPLQIYLAVDGQQVGPLDPAGFAGYLGTPEAAAATYVWLPGMAEWALASTVPALQPIIAAMGQTSSGEMAAPADPASFMLGAWFSERFDWTVEGTKYTANIQMKLLPDGRFEGATLFRDKTDIKAPVRFSHEKGTWTVAATADGKFTFDRNIFFTDVVQGVVTRSGQMEDKFVLKATGPNDVISDESIKFVRIPDSQ